MNLNEWQIARVEAMDIENDLVRYRKSLLEIDIFYVNTKDMPAAVRYALNEHADELEKYIATHERALIRINNATPAPSTAGGLLFGGNA